MFGSAHLFRAVVVVAIVMIAIEMIAIVVIAVVIVTVTVIEIVMIEIVTVYHMLEVPARLFVIAARLFIGTLKAFVVILQQPAVTDIAASFATVVAAAIPAAGRKWRTIAAIAFARFVDEAIVLAMPIFEMAIVIAPPIAVAAIIGAAPPAEIAIAVARMAPAVAFMLAIPAMPPAIVVAAPSLAAFVVAMPPASPVAASVELDLRHGIERIEHHGIRHRNARIFIGAAGFAGEHMRRQTKSQSENHRAEHCVQKSPAFAVREDCIMALHRGTLLQ